VKNGSKKASQIETDFKKNKKQTNKKQLARARKVEQLGCTDAEFRQPCGVVADEPST